MRGYNHVNLVGNLTADPVIKMAGDFKYATFYLAVSEAYKTPGGEVRNNTTFVPIVAWGKVADICEKYLSKGQRIHVVGKLRIKAVSSTDSGRKWYTSILLKELLFLESKQQSEQLVEAELADIPAEALEPEELDDLSMLENSQYSE